MGHTFKLPSLYLSGNSTQFFFVIGFTPLHVHVTCFPSSSSSISRVIVLPFPFKNKCFFSPSTLHCKKMQMPTSSRAAPCGRKDISALSTPKGICVCASSIFKSGATDGDGLCRKIRHSGRDDKDQLPVRPLLFGGSKQMPPWPSSLSVLSLGEDKCTPLTFELRMGAKRKVFFFLLTW